MSSSAISHIPLVLELIARQAARRGMDAALLPVDRPPIDFARLHACIAANMAALTAAGCGPGARIATLLPNGPDAAIAALTAMSFGVCMPLNPGLRSAELRFELVDGRAGAVVLAAEGMDEAQAVARSLGLAVLELPAPSADDGRPAPWQIRERRRGIVTDAPGEIALVLHTSGTTGLPKLVPLTHANLLAGARATAEHLNLVPSDRGLSAMPFFHTHGLVGSLLASLWVGASVVCTPGFDPRRWVEWIVRFQPTWYTASPTIHQAFVGIGELYRLRAPDHRFRVVRSTSSALAPATRAALVALTGAPIVEAYALTEAPGQVAATTLPPVAGEAGSVGRPTGTNVTIIDAAGAPVPPGASGEIVVDGTGVIGGYEVDGHIVPFADGRLHTGDIGVVDACGLIRVLGRAKEVINRGGEKISPREVDERLLDHPDVADAAAFGVPHPRLGEDLVAAVVPRAGCTPEPAALRAFLAERLSDSRCPSRVIVVVEIPKGPTGKVRRSTLAEAFAPQLERAHAEPRNAVERDLVAIWRDALQADVIGIDDNFFARGGDSLNAVSLLIDVEHRFGRLCPLATLFEFPTIREFAGLIVGNAAPRASTVVPIHPEGARPPLFFMSGWGSQLMVFNPLAYWLGNDQPLYALDPSALTVASGATLDVETVAARMVADIRNVYPDGPYHLAGFSLGGRFVWEIAQQLRRSGANVGMVAVLDCDGPGFPGRPNVAVRAWRHLRYAIGLGPVAAIAHVAERTLNLRRRIAPKTKTMFADERLEHTPLAKAMLRTSLALADASRRYVTRAYPGGLLLVRATDRPVQPAVDESDPTMGWGTLSLNGVLIRSLASDHEHMLDAQYAPSLASVLVEAMGSPVFANAAEFTTMGLRTLAAVG